MPREPIRPVWNESLIRQHDYNDIFGSSMYFSQNQDPAEREYEEAMDVYRAWLECMTRRQKATGVTG